MKETDLVVVAEETNCDFGYGIVISMSEEVGKELKQNLMELCRMADSHERELPLLDKLIDSLDKLVTG